MKFGLSFYVITCWLFIFQVVSLNEKFQVQAKDMLEEPLSENKVDPLPVDIAQIFGMKLDEHMSSGSVGSAVVDEGSPHVVIDSVDSYFPADNYGGCVAPIERVQSEEDDGSDDGRCCFDVFVASETEQQNHDGEGLNWWGNMYYVAWCNIAFLLSYIRERTLYN